MPYSATRTFWLEPTDRVAVGLRRYRSAEGSGFTCEDGYHSALVFTGESEAVFDDIDGRRILADRSSPDAHVVDRRWPTQCRCGYTFTEDDAWQDWQELLYRRTDTGEIVSLREDRPDTVGAPATAPAGASWDAWWMGGSWRGTDGIALMVRCPNGRDWHVDGEASNCTRPGQPHECWVRHGDPRECKVTVDKQGDTCAAGAGSIVAGDYHGFLQDGVLTAG
jgi:hypothetical protein